MAARAKYGLGLIAVGVLAAVLAPLAGGALEQATSASAERPNAIISILKKHGKINGTIFAVQPASELNARVSVSLHHLAPATNYVVAATTKGCSHTAPTESRAFRFAAKTSASGDDAFKSAATDLRKPVTDVRSVRVYQQGADGEYHQASCGVVDNLDVFQ